MASAVAGREKPSRRPILIVTGDPETRANLTAIMDMAGHPVIACGSATGLVAALAERGARVSAVLLDFLLPDGNGRDLCRMLRRSRFPLPVIMLAGPAQESELVASLDDGAWDFMVKPFRTAELVARVRAALRVHAASTDASVDVGPYVFTPSTRVLARPGHPRIILSEKEAGLLWCLYCANGHHVARDALKTEVWGDADARSHTLDTHVYRLRRKIEHDPNQPTMLLTSPGGYRLASSLPFGPPMPTTWPPTWPATRFDVNRPRDR